MFNKTTQFIDINKASYRTFAFCKSFDCTMSYKHLIRRQIIRIVIELVFPSGTFSRTIVDVVNNNDSLSMRHGQ